jgi:hypothetical protein
MAAPQSRKERSPQAVYSQRLQDSLQLLDRNFRGLLGAAQVDTKSGTSAAADHDRERLQIDLNTANIVKAGEELLRLVDELKLPAIANDFERCENGRAPGLQSACPPPPRATRASTTTTTRHRRPFGWGLRCAALARRA